MSSNSTSSGSGRSNEISDLRRTFALFDVDGSGFIEQPELRSCLQILGQNPTQADIEDIMREADVLVQDGRIDFEEFERIIRASFKFKSAREMDGELLAAFQLFDRDKNGLISRQELRHVLTSIGEQLTEAEFEEMFKCADANEDGHISYREFVSLFNHSFRETKG